MKKIKKQVIMLIFTLISVIILCGTVSATNGTWNMENISNSGSYTAMALDSNDNPHMAYIDSSGLMYATKTGSTWSVPEVVDSNISFHGFCDIAIDSSNNPRISYYDNSNGHDHILKYAYKDGTGWHLQNLTNINNTGDFNSIVVDSSGNTHISYADASSNWKLMYIKQSGASWNPPEVVHDEVNVGGSTSIALDSAENPRIAYFANFIGLTGYAYKDGTGWHHEYANSQSTGYTNGWVSLALDSFGYPHISYLEYDPVTTHERLAYAYMDSSGWQTRQIVDNSSNRTGWYTSLALDSSNKPHISYYDMTNGDLKYAYWTGTEWKITTVDSNGNVGRYTSIALDAAGNPHIAYAGSVHYAYFMPDIQQSIVPSSGTNSSGNPVVYGATQITSEKNTVRMQETGIPIAGLILAILMLFGGAIGSKR